MGLRPAACRISAIIPAVVVLPLVELTTIEPRSSWDASRSIASGAILTRRRPGSVVPPPRPLRRLRAATPRARPRFASKSALIAEARLGGPRWRDHPERAGQRAQGRRQVREVLAIGVYGEVLIGADLDRRAAHLGDLLVLDVLALEHLGQIADVAQLADVADSDHVEQAVVELGVGGDEHAAAEGPAVGDSNRVALEPKRLAA